MRKIMKEFLIYAYFRISIVVIDRENLKGSGLCVAFDSKLQKVNIIYISL